MPDENSSPRRKNLEEAVGFGILKAVAVLVAILWVAALLVENVHQ